MKALKKVLRRLEERRHAFDLMVQKMTPKEREGYTRPGSMNSKKS